MKTILIILLTIIPLWGYGQCNCDSLKNELQDCRIVKTHYQNHIYELNKKIIRYDKIINDTINIHDYIDLQGEYNYMKNRWYKQYLKNKDLNEELSKLKKDNSHYLFIISEIDYDRAIDRKSINALNNQLNEEVKGHKWYFYTGTAVGIIITTFLFLII